MLYFDETQNIMWILDLVILSGACHLYVRAYKKIYIYILRFVQVKQRFLSHKNKK